MFNMSLTIAGLQQVIWDQHWYYVDVLAARFGKPGLTSRVDNHRCVIAILLLVNDDVNGLHLRNTFSLTKPHKSRFNYKAHLHAGNKSGQAGDPTPSSLISGQLHFWVCLNCFIVQASGLLAAT